MTLDLTYFSLVSLQISDIGASIIVHAFAAYFGLAVSRAMYKEAIEDSSSKASSVYHSDLFSLIGETIYDKKSDVGFSIGLNAFC